MQERYKSWLNTRVEYIKDSDKLVFTLYSTDIVVVDFKSNMARLDCKGYNSVTTRRRMNQILELLGDMSYVYSKNYIAMANANNKTWELPVTIRLSPDAKYYMLFKHGAFKKNAPITYDLMASSFFS